MTPIQAVGLGIIQGLTEFLPISSSGHLVLAQNFVKGFSQPGVLFDAVLHAGTMLAVILYFRRAIASLDKRMLGLLAVGTIPAALFGVAFSGQVEGLFSNPRAVGIALILTGTMNLLVDRNWKTEDRRQKTEMEDGGQRVDAKKALVVGVFQAVAIIPGISRSGATIFAGVWQGFKREDAAVFSFLLSIPAVAAALVLQVAKYSTADSIDFASFGAGFAAAALVGYATIGVLLKLLLARHFKAFALYCFLLGLTTFLLSFKI